MPLRFKYIYQWLIGRYGTSLYHRGGHRGAIESSTGTLSGGYRKLLIGCIGRRYGGEWFDSFLGTDTTITEVSVVESIFKLSGGKLADFGGTDSAERYSHHHEELLVRPPAEIFIYPFRWTHFGLFSYHVSITNLGYIWVYLDPFSPKSVNSGERV